MADHLIDEVDDALRRERIETFWKRFGQYVVAGSIGILLVTIAAVVWQNHQQSKRQKWTSAMLAAESHISDKEYGKAIELLDTAEPLAQDELDTLTKIWRATVALKQQDDAAAHTALTDVSGEGAYRDFAALMAQSALKEENGEMPETFRYTAMETQAALLLGAGKTDEAQKLLTSLSQNGQTPASMRQRARLLLDHLAETDTMSSPSME